MDDYKNTLGTQDNLSQLLSAKYTFRNEVEKENGQLENKEISYETIKELNISPSVKRQVWQALLIVKEICKIQKTLPKRVFVEVAKEKRIVEEQNPEKETTGSLQILQ